jgi:hypothetical protein
MNETRTSAMIITFFTSTTPFLAAYGEREFLEPFLFY